MILFDFITGLMKQRLLFKVITFINKKFKGLIISIHFKNIFSKKGIENSGFTLIKTLKRF